MVSLEDRYSYFQTIKDTPKLLALNSFMVGELCDCPNETDEIYYEILNAITTNNKIDFERHYRQKSKSILSKESNAPFVNDDFLIFALIIGIQKFGIEKTWIENIISIRGENKITVTFKSIINKNYDNSENLLEIILMFFKLIKKDNLTNEFLNKTLAKVIKNTSLFEDKRDLLILSSIHAYDTIIELKVSPEGSHINLLNKFNELFLNRVKVMAFGINIFTSFTLCYLLVTYFPYGMPELEKLIKEYEKLSSFLGFAVIFGGNFISNTRKLYYKTALKMLGYPNDLIKQIIDKK